jgi:hypothetical protein
VDGDREIQAFWKESELKDTSKIRTLLEHDPLWEVYQLRAIVLIQGRVDAQLATLHALGNPTLEGITRESELIGTMLTTYHADDTGPWRLAMQLRKLELEMLEKTRITLDKQVRSCPCLRPTIYPYVTRPHSPLILLISCLLRSLTHRAQRSALLDTKTVQRYLGLIEDEGSDGERVDFT